MTKIYEVLKRGRKRNVSLFPIMLKLRTPYIVTWQYVPDSQNKSSSNTWKFNAARYLMAAGLDALERD